MLPTASAGGATFGSSSTSQRSVGLETFWLGVGPTSANFTDSSIILRAMLGDDFAFGFQAGSTF